MQESWSECDQSRPEWSGIKSAADHPPCPLPTPTSPPPTPHQPPPSADSHSRPPMMHTRLSFPLLVADFRPLSILLNPFLPPHVFSLPSFPFCRCFELGNPSYPRASFEKNLSSFIQTILRICYLLSRNMTNQISLHFSAFLCITLHFTF